MGALDSWGELGKFAKDTAKQLYEDWRTAGPAEHGPSHQERCGGMLTGDEMRWGVKKEEKK